MVQHKVVLVQEVVHLRQTNIALASELEDAASQAHTQAESARAPAPSGGAAASAEGTRGGCAAAESKSPARESGSWSASGRKRPNSDKRLRKKLTLENVRLRAELERWKRRDRQCVASWLVCKHCHQVPNAGASRVLDVVLPGLNCTGGAWKMRRGG